MTTSEMTAWVARYNAAFAAACEVDPFDSPEYQAFVEGQAKHCRCALDRPCDGVLAGGLCDNIQERDMDDVDDGWDPVAGESR